MFLNTSKMEYKESAVFGKGHAVLESALKNPNQFREAIIYESIANLPDDKVDEFVKSDEAKYMVDKGYISDETIERLKANTDNKCMNTTVCHMAKEAGDPLWDELVACRLQERRIMDALIEKYKVKAAPIADNVETDFIENCIPKYFRKK